VRGVLRQLQFTAADVFALAPVAPVPALVLRVLVPVHLGEQDNRGAEKYD